LFYRGPRCPLAFAKTSADNRQRWSILLNASYLVILRQEIADIRQTLETIEKAASPDGLFRGLSKVGVDWGQAALRDYSRAAHLAPEFYREHLWSNVSRHVRFTFKGRRVSLAQVCSGPKADIREQRIG
jgi:hypothetical protein